GLHSLEVSCPGLAAEEGMMSPVVLMPDGWSASDGISVSFYVEGDEGPEGISWLIREVDAGGSPLRTEITSSDTMQSGSHVRIQHAFIPQDPACAGVRAEVWQSTSHEGKFWIDAFLVEGTNSVGTFFHGD